jgi:hypothetical protein
MMLNDLVDPIIAAINRHATPFQLLAKSGRHAGGFPGGERPDLRKWYPEYCSIRLSSDGRNSNRIPQRKLDFLPTPRSNSKIWFTRDFPKLEIAPMMDITAFLLKHHSMPREQFMRRFFRRRLPSLQTISRASHIPNKPLADLKSWKEPFCWDMKKPQHGTRYQNLH